MKRSFRIWLSAILALALIAAFSFACANSVEPRRISDPKPPRHVLSSERASGVILTPPKDSRETRIKTLGDRASRIVEAMAAPSGERPTLFGKKRRQALRLPIRIHLTEFYISHPHHAPPSEK